MGVPRTPHLDVRFLPTFCDFGHRNGDRIFLSSPPEREALTTGAVVGGDRVFVPDLVEYRAWGAHSRRYVW